MTGPLIHAAAALAEAGFAVFPCGADKAPVIATGFKAATCNRADVERLFRRSGAALIGVATGTASGAAVLDLDGEPGLAWGARWLSGPQLPHFGTTVTLAFQSR